MQARTGRVARAATVVFLAIAAASMTTAIAADAAGDDAAGEAPGWNWSITPYLWATEIREDLLLDGRVVGGNDTEFKDLVDKIESSLQLHFEGVRDRWGMFLDLSTVEVSDSGEGEFGILRLDADIEEMVIEAGAIYRPAGGARHLDVLFGVRYLKIDEDYRITGGLQPRSLAVDEDYVDALVGVRYHVPLSERWLISLRGDVSAPGTDFTWTAQGLVGWQFGKRLRSAIFLGYRYRALEYDKGDFLQVDKSLSGPGLGLKIGF